MKERVFAAVRGMKREQWLICGLAGLLLLVIAAPVKQKEQKKTQEEIKVQSQEQADVAGRRCGNCAGGGGDGIHREETGGKRQPGGYQHVQ